MDIVNIGTIPAKVNEVGVINMSIPEGNSVLMVKGLDAVKEDHPIVQPKEKCNIHFTVEWPEDSTEQLTGSNNIIFGLEIEYVQATDETFLGKTSHTHESGSGITPTYSIPELTAQAGQTLADIESQLPDGYAFQDELTTSVGDSVGKVSFKATYTPTNVEGYNVVTDIDISVNVVKTGRLSELVDGDDYGKNVDYSVTVNGVELNNWRIFNNDGTNVQIILDKYLPHSAIPEEILNFGLAKSSKNSYGVITTELQPMLDALKSPEWSDFVKDLPNATVQGAPTLEKIVESWNTNPETNQLQLQISEDTKNDLLGVPFKDLSNDAMSEYEMMANTDSSRLYLPYATMFQNNYNLLGYYITSENKDDHIGYAMINLAALTMSATTTGNTAYPDEIITETAMLALRPVITLPADQIGTLGDTLQLQLSE